MAENRSRIFTRTFLLLSAYGMFALALSLLLVTGLPLYLQEQGWDPSQIGWILGMYFLTSLLVRPLVGREADRRGHKAIMIIGAALMLVACPFYLIAKGPVVLALRVLQGLGWAMATTATAALASQIVPQDRIGAGMGIFGILNGLGFTFGPALGAYLLSVGGGAAFLGGAAGLAAITLACAILISPPKLSAGPVMTWRAAGATIVPLARPLAVTIAVSFGYGAVQTFLPLYASGSGVTNPGIFFTVFSLLSFGSRPGMGRLSDIWGRKSTATLLMLIISGAFSLLAYSASFGYLVAAAVLYGIGHGAIFTVLMALLADLTPPERRGLTYGVFGTAIDFGITLGNFLLGMVVAGSGYSGSFMLAAAVVIVSLPLVWTSPARVVAVPTQA